MPPLPPASQLQYGHALTEVFPGKAATSARSGVPPRWPRSLVTAARQTSCLPLTFLFHLGMNTQPVTCLKLTFETQRCKWGVDLWEPVASMASLGYSPPPSPRGNQPNSRNKNILCRQTAGRAFHPRDLCQGCEQWSVVGVWVCATAQKEEFPNDLNAGNKGIPQP